jgi:hypothetical protein
MPDDRLPPDESTAPATGALPPVPAEPTSTQAYVHQPPADMTAANAPTQTKADGIAPPQASQGSFGKYELLEPFPGGMGIVFRAHDRDLNRVVALKMLPAAPGRRQRDHDRFIREARTIAALKHEFIIPIHDFGEIDNQPYFTTDFIERGSLQRNMLLFRDEPRKAVEFMEKAARAVHYAHQNNIVHRDLKPGNILVSDKGEPLISDFGLAKMIDQDATKTADGSILGTPAYMSPEQAKGKLSQVGVRSDLWSLGVVLYEMLAGKRPFPGTERDSVAARVINDLPPRLRENNAQIDPSLEAVVMRCLEKEPDHRYVTAAALADDLRAWLERQPVQAFVDRRRRSRRRFLAAGAGLLGLCAAGGTGAYFFSRRNSRDAMLARLRAELADNGKVELIGPDGRPRWSEWIRGESEITPLPDEQAFAIESKRIAVLDLLPDTGFRDYVFRAEVRLDGPGSAGIYMGRSTMPNVLGEPMFAMVCLEANLGGNGPMRSFLAKIVCTGTDGGVPIFDKTLDGDGFLAGDTWSEVRFVVRSNEVFWKWPERAENRFVLHELAAKFRDSTEIKGSSRYTEVNPKFSPREGIGVFATGTRAAFRNVWVERPTR